jgi:hypothetical protein
MLIPFELMGIIMPATVRESRGKIVVFTANETACFVSVEFGA